MKDFRDLGVWAKSHALVLTVYKATAAFPKSEIYGFTPWNMGDRRYSTGQASQIRRAASSIPANIAEGCGRGGDRDFARFLQIAMGSASELEYYLLLVRDLGFLDTRQYDTLSTATTEVKRMLTGFIQKLRAGSS